MFAFSEGNTDHLAMSISFILTRVTLLAQEMWRARNATNRKLNNRFCYFEIFSQQRKVSSKTWEEVFITEDINISQGRLHPYPPVKPNHNVHKREPKRKCRSCDICKISGPQKIGPAHFER